SSGAVSLWEDQSGSGNHASQGTANNRPTQTVNNLNGQTALLFDGNDFLNVADHATLNPTQVTAIVVAKQTSGGTNYAGYVGKSSSAGSNGYGVMKSNVATGVATRVNGQLATGTLGTNTYGI